MKNHKIHIRCLFGLHVMYGFQNMVYLVFSLWHMIMAHQMLISQRVVMRNQTVDDSFFFGLKINIFYTISYF